MGALDQDCFPEESGRENRSGPLMIDPPLTLSLLLRRALRLRCPVCGVGRIYSGYAAMAARCSDCRYGFERESGYFLGSIYFNYGLTGGLVMVTLLSLQFGAHASEWVQAAIVLPLAVLFPLLFFRFARSLWMAMDLCFDGPKASDFEPRPWHPESERSSPPAPGEI